MRPSISLCVAEGRKNRAMLLFGMRSCSTWFGFSSSMIERMRAGVSEPSLE